MKTKVITIIKVLLIIMIYVFMFWGLFKGCGYLIHKLNNKECSCNIYINDNKIETKEEPLTIKQEENEKKIVNEVKKAETVKKVVNKVKTTKKTTTKATTTKKNNTKTNTTKKTTTVKQDSKSKYQSYAHNLVINSYGWSEADYEALVKLWNRESGWNPNAHNKKSGAHGIPQSLPAKKMASEGSDYYTNGYTQIRWGLKYIKKRYGTPSAAWAHSQRTGWY